MDQETNEQPEMDMAYRYHTALSACRCNICNCCCVTVLCLLTPLLRDQLDAGFDHGLRHEQVGRLRRVDAVEEHVAAGVPARPARRRVAEVHPRLRRPRPAARPPRVREA